MERLDSVTEKMEEINLMDLLSRRNVLNLLFLRKVEFGLIALYIRNYISFNQNYNTRGGTINPHFKLGQFKYSFFNQMREHVKALPFGIE